MLRRIKTYLADLYIYCQYLLSPFSKWESLTLGDVETKRNYSLYELLVFIKEHNSYFAEYLNNKEISIDNSIDVLKGLPLLDKAQIRKIGKYIYSGFVTEDYKKWQNTGGSTGEPLIFPVGYGKILSPHLEYMHQRILYNKMGYKNSDVICSVDGSRIPNQLLEREIYWINNPSNFPYGIYSYSTMYLNSETAEYYISHINKLKPSFLRGYPSGIKLLCQFVESLNLSIDFKLKGCYLTSENFDESTADYISKILKCQVWGQYGHSEASVFAYKKPNSPNYYCFPLYGYTEILDEQGNHVEKGELGEIVVTGFSNRAMPFIRYKTGDLAVYGGVSPKGEVIFEKLLGRSNDYIFNSHGEKIYLVGFIFGGHLHAFNHIRSWQFVQKVKGYLDILIVKDESFIESDENEIKLFMKDNGFIINIVYIEEIPKTKGGKQQFLIQEIK